MSRIFGIDLGTTNSLIAAMENGEPRVLQVGDKGSALLPSVVAIAPDGAVIVGFDSAMIDRLTVVDSNT